MKKKFFYITSALIVALAISYAILDERVETVVADANFHKYEKFDEMVAESELIAIGSPVDSKNDVELTEEGFLISGHTTTTLGLKRIEKNKTGNNLSVGSTIPVIEPYYVIENGIEPGKTLFSIGGYAPMEKDASYILFLKENDEKSYNILGIVQGKFNVDGKDQDEFSRIDNSKEKLQIFKKSALEQFN